jgi:hypothetical protein
MAGRKTGGFLRVAVCALFLQGARAAADDFDLSRLKEILSEVGAATRALRVQTILSEIERLDAVELSCGGRGVCPIDLISYDKSSVDERVAAALKVVPGFIESGQRDAAVIEIAKIKGVVKYSGNKLAPSRTPLYRAVDVDGKIEEALGAVVAPR